MVQKFEQFLEGIVRNMTDSTGQSQLEFLAGVYNNDPVCKTPAFAKAVKKVMRNVCKGTKVE